jgi:AMMECR1 domain-containing protein
MNAYSKLARSAAEEFVLHGTVLTPPPMLPSELLVQRACYVSVFQKPGRRLRGMAGSPMPSRASLAEEIIANTVEAITWQPRRADLDGLEYAVAVISPLQRINDPAHLDPLRFGLYVRSERGQSAVVLPGRVGIETGDDQIATAIREAGIDMRRDVPSLYRFQVTWHE